MESLRKYWFLYYREWESWDSYDFFDRLCVLTIWKKTPSKIPYQTSYLGLPHTGNTRYLPTVNYIAQVQKQSGIQGFRKYICDLFPCIHMLNFYNSVGHEASEVVVLHRNVLCARSHLQGNYERDRNLIVFMHNVRIFKKTGFYLGDVIFKFEHKGNFLHKTHKILNIPHCLTERNILGLFHTDCYLHLYLDHPDDRTVSVYNYVSGSR